MEKEILQDIVKKEISQKMVMKRLFTTYEIWKKILTYLPNSKVSVDEVREAIQEDGMNPNGLFVNADYSATQGKLYNGKKVTIYHPCNLNPGEVNAYIDEINELLHANRKNKDEEDDEEDEEDDENSSDNHKNYVASEEEYDRLLEVYEVAVQVCDSSDLENLLDNLKELISVVEEVDRDQPIGLLL